MVLEGQGIFLKKGGSQILRGVDFAAHSGEFVCLIGPNGAGKSTLLACLAGEAQSDGGQILFRGVPLANLTLPLLARERAVMWQEASAAAGLSVYDLVALGRVPHGDETTQAGQTAIAQALDEADLTHLAVRSYETLSGGERQRVDFARALCQLHGVAKPLLLLDEPIASLDLKYQYHILHAARRFVDAGGCCICVLHDLPMVRRFSDRVVLMKTGQIFAEGQARQVLGGTTISAAFDLPEEWVA